MARSAPKQQHVLISDNEAASLSELARPAPEEVAAECDCPNCQRLKAGLFVMRRKEDAEAGCGWLGNPCPAWLCEAMQERPTSRSMMIVCVGFIVVGW
jgi:hypothetical protein